MRRTTTASIRPLTMSPTTAMPTIPPTMTPATTMARTTTPTTQRITMPATTMARTTTPTAPPIAAAQAPRPGRTPMAAAAMAAKAAMAEAMAAAATTEAASALERRRELAVRRGNLAGDAAEGRARQQAAIPGRKPGMAVEARSLQPLDEEDRHEQGDVGAGEAAAEKIPPAELRLQLVVVAQKRQLGLRRRRLLRAPALGIGVRRLGAMHERPDQWQEDLIGREVE